MISLRYGLKSVSEAQSKYKVVEYISLQLITVKGWNILRKDYCLYCSSSS
jgi:hypothetical protein